MFNVSKIVDWYVNVNGGEIRCGSQKPFQKMEFKFSINSSRLIGGCLTFPKKRLSNEAEREPSHAL